DSVSRHHCTIHYDSRRNIFLVKDVSANGTFTARGLVGRGRVAEVAPGERIYLVSNKYELYLEVK
ncbi:MAG: FHA domain-containing protein, partial [Lachnospiraceae bacterium]|nr:FHA domain-containing protein [Lachnospiraceae bacterium]